MGGAGLRVTMLGMPCAASEPVLAALLAAPGIAVASLVLALPGDDETPETDDDSPAERMAVAGGVPVTRARSIAEAAARVVADAPDAVAVACFPWRLPPWLLALPRLGCLNVHPSLLPAGRGPEPVFWTLRRGERESGATVHLMDAGFDTGPVVAQVQMPVPDDARAPDLESALMALGGTLLVDALPKLAAGSLRPIPQDDAAATYAPLPSPADWLLPTSLPAGWAFRFARGVAPLGGPLAAQGRFGLLPVREAVAHDPFARPDQPLVEHADGTTTVRFTPGWVRFAVDEATGMSRSKPIGG